VAKLWRYATGQKGINRITVYERRPGGPIHIEWWDRDGRHRETLKNLTGSPIVSHALAEDVADACAAAQKKRREADDAHELLGRDPPRTFRELTDAYHGSKEEGWSEHHRRIQRGLRDFWLLALGGDMRLTDASPARVQQVVRTKAAAARWSTRTQQKYLRYIVDAFSYAQRKLKWINEGSNLSAVDIPRAGGESRAYSLEEVSKLLATSAKGDPRICAMLWVAWSTGRRLAAIRTLSASAVEHEGSSTRIAFPGATDKARRSGVTYLGPRARAAVCRLYATPAVTSSGLLFPDGDLSKATPKRSIASDTQCRKWLRQIEALSGVEHRDRRAFHGIKRRFASTSSTDGAAAEKQSGTNRATLARIYHQDDPEPKKKLAEKLEAAVAGV
jgi:integrase